MRRPTSPLIAALTGLLSAAMGLTLAAPGAGAYAADEPSPGIAQSVADDSGSLREQAVEALDDVQGLLGDDDAPAEPGTPALTDDGRDLTIALRDLAALRGELPPAQEREADAILARPTDSGGASYGATYRVDEAPPLCSKRACVHYVTSTEDASTRAYARRVLGTVSQVDATYAGAGYRQPKRDGRAEHNGGNAKPDIYLADIGDQRIYGFCTTDQPFELGTFDVWTYCVLDNDYASSQFPENSPTQNLKVTAAHEYFHAVQFGYDYTEDDWFLEGTATWAEDELFDGVDDNVQYLPYGPMGRPALVMDQDRSDFEVYGSWSFFRFLTERYPAATNGLPTLVRDFWNRADSRGDAPDDYSLQAVRSVLRARGVDVSEVFADYAAANLHPAAHYDEGAANDYPSAPLAGGRILSKQVRAYDGQGPHQAPDLAQLQGAPVPGVAQRALGRAAAARGAGARLRRPGPADLHPPRRVVVDPDGPARPPRSGRRAPAVLLASGPQHRGQPGQRQHPARRLLQPEDDVLRARGRPATTAAASPSPPGSTCGLAEAPSGTRRRSDDQSVNASDWSRPGSDNGPAASLDEV